jgi:uncharacterized membrane protein SpoIIM required for sporulation
MSTEARMLRCKTLSALLDRVEARGIGALSVEEVQVLGRLYRHVTIDLARARAEQRFPEEIRYLNNLAARAHGQVYRSRPVDLRQPFSFLLTGFPRLFRKHLGVIACAFSVFLLATCASIAAVVRDPMLAYSLYDEDYVEHENIRLEKHGEEYRGNFTFTLRESPLMAVIIIVNNILVAARAFAFGALFCIPCLFLLIYNGRMLGTLEGMMLLHGQFLSFNSLILTHGVLELSAICIAGGSGLLLGWAILAPGEVSRATAMRKAAGDAFGLFGGAAAILVVAGLIEAFVTPLAPAIVRWCVIVLSTVLLLAYLFLAGRKAPGERHSSVDA